MTTAFGTWLDAFFDAAHFSAISDGAAHLHREFGYDFLILSKQRVEKRRHFGFAFGERRCRPRALCASSGGYDRLDLGGRRGSAARKFGAIDRGNTNDIVHASSISPKD